VKERAAGAPTFPGASIARTEKLWAPSASGWSLRGELQLLKAPASTRHWKVEPGSLDLKLKLGVGLLMMLPSLGPAVMVAVGGVVSAVKPLNV
jgi:hypothetical protein